MGIALGGALALIICWLVIGSWSVKRKFEEIDEDLRRNLHCIDYQSWATKYPNSSLIEICGGEVAT